MTRRPARILVVSPCTARKKSEPTTARDIYTGSAHVIVVAAVDRLRAALPDTEVDLAIISAGYGLLDEYDLVRPYNKTFRGLSKKALIVEARRLGIRKALTERLPRYDLAVMVLGRDYLTALELPLTGSLTQHQVYFTSGSPPAGADLHVRAGAWEAHQIGVSPRIAFAELFSRWAGIVIRRGWDQALGYNRVWV